ncbi:hypothetical protein OROMI_024596 [Orobanche minor]
MFATRILINEDVPELADFMNIIKENSDARQLISKQSLSHGSYALSDDFSTLLQFKSICELDSTTEKVSVLDKSYWCEKCKMRSTSVLTRFLQKYIYQLFIDGSTLLKPIRFFDGYTYAKTKLHIF